MGKGKNSLAPLNRALGKVDPVVRLTNQAAKNYFGIDPTREDEGLQQEPEVVYLSNGTSSRQVVSGSSGSIKKVYDKKDNKR